MDGNYRTDVEVSLADMRLERLSQDASGPFQRTHDLDHPSLVYIPVVHREPARGCFGTPQSHLSFGPFGAAVVVPAHTPLHVVSPGFAPRTMVIARFEIARFSSVTGIGPACESPELIGCRDVRARGVADAMERLALELDNPATARDTMVAGLGLVLLGELARYFEKLRDGALGRRGMLADWQMRRIETRLTEDDRPPPRLEELAQACGIGRRHLMRAFKATTGATVMERVERAAFERATRLLEESVMPIKKIATSLGYDCQGSFSTAFARRYGTSPRAWRAQRRSERTLQ